MGKKTKTGKHRKDKFYQLAKETGYRSRAAFKLIQLNRKHEFLQKSRVLIDLCAAPGGWLQVASEHMPVSSVIVGIDLVPIRPIRNVICIKEDITTPQCRQLIKKELQTWKADCVLHDGAPNVGKNWIQDAYSQAELTLGALKLATEFLQKGGWFVTKVFRSKDYNSLLWVLQQLFKKVFATKPQASRLESAEIFVVCQGYLAPDKLDPKFLDPKYVFADVQLDPVVSSKKLVDTTSKKKKKAEGYAEGDTTLFHKTKATDFIKGGKYLEILNSTNEIYIDDDAIAQNPLTTTEIRECIADIKVLGRKELKLLLKWRKNLAKILYPKEEVETAPEPVETEDEEEAEEKRIEEEIEAFQLEQMRELKIKKRKVLLERRKLRDKMNLKMIIPDDNPVVSTDPSLFRMSTIRNRAQLDALQDKDLTTLDEHLMLEDENEDTDKLPKFIMYSKDEAIPDDYDGADNSSGSDAGSDDDSDKSIGGLENDDSDDESNAVDEEEVEVDSKLENPLITDLDFSSKEEKEKRKVDLWFGKECFAGLEDDDIDEFKKDVLEKRNGQRSLPSTGKQTNGTLKNGHKDMANGDVIEKDDLSSDGSLMGDDENDATNVDGNAANSDDDDSSSSSDEDDDSSGSEVDDDNEIGAIERKLQAKAEKKMAHESKKDGFEIVPVQKIDKKKRHLDPEGLALGTMMIHSKKAKRDILDLAWNRYAHNDENLPAWFAKDEELNYKKVIQVTKEMVQEYKQELREIDARPLKKVVQAKARKKKRMVRKLERARKKAESLMEEGEMPDKEKMQNIKAIYKKAGIGVKPKKEVSYVVAKKGLSGKRVGRPSGVKGRFKVVDPRMKKDDMRRKKDEKQGRKGKKTASKGPQKKGRGRK